MRGPWYPSFFCHQWLCGSGLDCPYSFPLCLCAGLWVQQYKGPNLRLFGLTVHALEGSGLRTSWAARACKIKSWISAGATNPSKGVAVMLAQIIQNVFFWNLAVKKDRYYFLRYYNRTAKPFYCHPGLFPPASLCCLHRKPVSVRTH